MSLPPRVQMLVDQMLDELKCRSPRPSIVTINIDKSGIVQDVRPEFIFRRDKETGQHAS